MSFLTLSIIDLLSQPWHWAFSGLIIALVLLVSTWAGKSFGVSSSYKVFCSMAGAGKFMSFFNLNLKDEFWRVAFVAGTVLGGYIASHHLHSPEPIAISTATIDHLQNDYGMTYPKDLSEGDGYIPLSLYNLKNLKGMLLACFGGFLVGFGARYGDGCTSGHAITGLAHLQLPSLITVIGFFIGGLIMTFGILPFILG
ncbi:MAG: YeeE/YedE family protein [Saprospiraceae bacterium]|nr:YeeE/YedE family protein [Saprospiraceae bacterium]MCB9322436.1 YeeE/YedE family protein [Lewinellaceae bacterium]